MTFMTDSKGVVYDYFSKILLQRHFFSNFFKIFLKSSEIVKYVFSILKLVEMSILAALPMVPLSRPRLFALVAQITFSEYFNF